MPCVEMRQTQSDKRVLFLFPQHISIAPMTAMAPVICITRQVVKFCGHFLYQMEDP